MNIRVKTPAVVIELRQLAAADAKVNEGLSAIPFTTFKTQNRSVNKTTWWGIHLLAKHKEVWVSEDFDLFKKRFIIAINTLADGTSLCTKLDQITRSVADFVGGRQRALMYGGESNQLLTTTLGKGIQIEILHDIHLDHQSRSYGGYFGFVEVLKQHKPFLVFHRGITLYNYLSREETTALIVDELMGQFPMVFTETPRIRIAGRVERQRCGAIVTAPETIRVKHAAPVIVSQVKEEAKSRVG